jgi:hypothetical protein
MLLILKSDVTLRNRVWIVENENGSFKANIVLAKILVVLVLIHVKRIASRDKTAYLLRSKMSIHLYVYHGLSVARRYPASNVGQSAALSTTSAREIAVSRWLLQKPRKQRLLR